MGYKHKDKARLLKRDWKLVSMAKEIIIDLFYHLQPFVTTLKKNPNNWSSRLAAINKYWKQAFYNWFKNIDKVLSSNKFFCHLGIVVKQYKNRQLLIAIWFLNNITAYRLLTICCRVPSDSYCFQITYNFEKLLDQKGMKNISMITILILLIFCMHIGPTRFLEDGVPNAKFDANKRLRLDSTNLDWDDSAKIEETIVADKDNKNEKKDLWEKNRQLKRQKQRQKQATKAKTRPKTC